ncbi:MAG TPA: type I methionyl aminopeptidase [Candidatus Levybacteria bacterium]|nr:type I methionyl aminopeptidase [Candidatus Levybacteria bacterium]
MKNNTKTSSQIEIMAKAGEMLGVVLAETLALIKPGITELELDEFADKRIVELGGYPGFKKVEGYKHAICVATNDIVVHGIPKKRILRGGDIIAVDAGVFLDGFHSDMAETVIVGKAQNNGIHRFLELGKKAMYAGIMQAKPGNRVGDISKAIQEIVEKQGGYSVVHSLVGHGVGRDLHEGPQVPGYLRGRIEKTPLLVPSMTIAVEVIYNMGDQEVEYEGSDDWTIATKDHSLSGVFERTIVITDAGPKLLTHFPGEQL